MNRLWQIRAFVPFILCWTACTRSTVSSTDNGIRWSLVTDSTFQGVGAGNHAVDYVGVAGDFFSFSTDGHVYTKEGSTLDTLTYNQLSDSTVIISHFGLILNGIPDTSKITGLKSNLSYENATGTIVVESPFFLTPGGEFWRKVTLNR